MAMRGNTDLEYTWYGVLVTDCDALLVLERCLRGELAHIPRRPHDSERARLIKSGSIFVYESNASGIKRWTDGINWSPSRILTNFLVYHELEKAPPPGEKKRAMKRKRSETELDDADHQSSHKNVLEEEWTDDDRRLMGSPQDNYGWKTGGLVKKTYSFDFRGASHHIISYFNPEDVKSGDLKRPIHSSDFQDTFIRPELIEQGARSRNPITEPQVEQQRWERPLYQNEAPASVMRQYSTQHAANFSPPPHMVSFQGHAPVMSPPHELVHRSSIHFPMEEAIYPGNVAGSIPHHVTHPGMRHRHMSLSGPVTNGFQQPAPIHAIGSPSHDTEAPYRRRMSAAPLSQGQPGANRGPADLKASPIHEDDGQNRPVYTSMAQHHPGFVIPSPPIGMQAVDTSYSHAIAKPSLYPAPHSATDVHPPQSHIISGHSVVKDELATEPFPNFTSANWVRSSTVPISTHEVPSTSAEYALHVPLDSFDFGQTHHNAGPALAHSHTASPTVYSYMASDYSSVQAPLAPSGYAHYSPLTAPS